MGEDKNDFFFMNTNCINCIWKFSDAEAGKLIKAVFAYVNRREKPDFPMGSRLSIAFDYMISEIDTSGDSEE